MVLRSGFDAETIVLISDAHMKTMSTKAAEEYAAQDHPKDELQRRYHAGDPDMEECLMVNIGRRGEQQSEFISLPYVRDRVSNHIRWLASRTTRKPTGVIPEFLAHIMSETPLIDDDSNDIRSVRRVAEQHGFTRERTLFHTGRVAMGFLVSRGYLVDDRISDTHPEWIE
jgi:hypothetical protein